MLLIQATFLLLMYKRCSAQLYDAQLASRYAWIHAVGKEGKIIASSDAGLSWQLQGTGVTPNDLNDVCFADLRNGLVVGSRGTAIMTRNHGISWESLSLTQLSLDFLGVYYMQATGPAYVVGEKGTFISTQDMSTWNTVFLRCPSEGSLCTQNSTHVTNDTAYIDLHGVRFSDFSNGVIVGSFGTAIQVSVDWSGQTNYLRLKSIDSIQYSLLRLASDRLSDLVACGTSMTIFRVVPVSNHNNNNIHWEWTNCTSESSCGPIKLDHIVGKNFLSCAIRNWIDGTMQVLVGTDSGSLLIYNHSTWVEHTLGINESLTGLYISSSDVIIAGTSTGKIFRTVNGGKTWIQIKAPAMQIRSMFGRSQMSVMNGSMRRKVDNAAAYTLMLSMFLSIMHISR